MRAQAEVYLRDNLRQSVEGNNYEWKNKAEGAFRFAYSNGRILFYLYDISRICTEKKFLLSVWLYGEEVVTHWKDAGGRERIGGSEYQLKLKLCNQGEKWEHLAEKEYEIPDIEEFGESVVQFLNNDWSDFLEDVTDILN